MEAELSALLSTRGIKEFNNDSDKDLLDVDMSKQPFVRCLKTPESSTDQDLTVVNADSYLENMKKAGNDDKGMNKDREAKSGGKILAVENRCAMSKLHLLKDLGQRSSIEPTVFVKRKLLVLDINGLLADIVMPAPKDRRGDTKILRRAIFKRPFCNDFLKFCFDNFNVAIWSSRSKKVINAVVEYLLGDLKDRLLFCWDMTHCTGTGFKTLENHHKPLVCKELKKIWEINDPDLPWKKGDYNESNTLFIDDSPYKALLNPKYTAIFPESYHYQDKDDSSLGPGGDLRVYLEGLLASENVQSYVEKHPFGQGMMNETNESWEFYSSVVLAMSRTARA